MFETELIDKLIQELEVLQAVHTQTAPDGAFAVMSDPDDALRVLQHLRADELRILVRPPDRVTGLLTPALTYRTVYDAAAFPAAGSNMRVATDVPITLVLADSIAAWVPGLLIRDDTLVHALGALFEWVWAGATPGIAGDPDRELLSLLVAGLTDEAAGTRLGLSRRTVARRVQHLMAVTGARSRLQLGWYARERNWL